MIVIFIYILMNKLLNFLRCSKISERIKIVEDLKKDISILYNNDKVMADLPEDIIYPEGVRIVPEKDIKFNVHISSYRLLVQNNYYTR